MNIRKFFFWSHLIIGVTFGILILVKAVTGVLLAYENQLVNWAEKSVRIVTPPSADAPRIPLAELMPKAQSENPLQKPGGVTVKSDPTASVAVNFGRDGGTVYMNPYNGDVLGKDSKMHDFMHLMDDIHRWFGFRPLGRPLSGAATIGFFLLACSGLYLWWPSTWTKNKVRSVTVFNGKLTGKARDWNWHNVIGFWMSPLLILITLTGVVMSYTWANNLVFRMTGTEPPAPQREGGMGGPGGIRGNGPRGADEAPMMSADELMARAQQQVAGWKSISLRLPQRAGGSVNAQILERELSFGIPARSQLTLDATTGDIKKWEPYSQANAGRKARTWVRYLHTGEAGGFIGETIALIASAAAAVLVWTGLALTWRRYSAWRGNRRK